MRHVRHLKHECNCCPVAPGSPLTAPPKDWEMHPSWIAGIEALHEYSHWVSSIVLPVAFQWIEEHRAEVYATVPHNLRDDVGTVLAAAFKLIRDLPAYKSGMDKAAAYEAAVANGETSSINPAWTQIVKKVRTETEAAFAKHPSLSVE